MVAGSLSALDLKQQIKAGNRQRKTVSGGTLTVTMQGKNIVLRDDGWRSTVSIPNVFQSNGVIQVVDTVVLPNQGFCPVWLQTLPARSAFVDAVCCGTEPDPKSIESLLRSDTMVCTVAILRRIRSDRRSPTY